MFNRSNRANLKLPPSRLNELRRSFACFADPASQTSVLTWLDQAGKERHVDYDIIIGNDVCVLFDVAKDNPDKANNPNLVYILELLAVALPMRELDAVAATYPAKEVRLIIPVAQSRLGKAHYVLLDVNRTRATMQVHDSKRAASNVSYPDVFNCDFISKQLGLLYQPAVHYHSYANQRDDELCGFYVEEYRRAIVSGVPFDEIVITVERNDSAIVVSTAGYDVTHENLAQYFANKGVNNLYETMPTIQSFEMTDFQM